MSINKTTEHVIASALSLTAEQRIAVMGAIHVSLADPGINHGSIGEVDSSVDTAQAAWKEEIARRIADVNNKRVKTVPADEAERMIRGDA